VNDLLQSVAIWALPVLVAVILHEIAHGWVANRLGDPTAKEAGRLTLNPLPHIDPFGTILLPAMLILAGSPFLFGYARPVPVNFMRLRRPKSDMVLVAAAGPLMNVLLAGISAVFLHSVGPDGGLLTSVLLASVLINVVLAVFNLFPILPLDGGRVLAGLLPMPAARAFARLEPFGMLAVFVLLVSGTLGQVIGPVVDVFLKALL
jgi:Zn-dependent protease